MLVIKNATIYASAKSPKYKGSIIIEGGKIKAIGSDIVTPDNAKTIDATGLCAFAGFIDAHSHVGGFGTGLDDQDLNEMTASATPEVMAKDAIDFAHPQFKTLLKAGITTSVITPGSGNVIGGMACAIKSGATEFINESLALKMAMGGNPKGVYGPRNQKPMTRMGIAAVIREKLTEAKDYMAKDKADRKANLGLDNIAKLLNKELSAKVHCEQFDMLTVMRLAKEYDFNFTLDHAWGASDYYDEIENSNCVGVIYGPIGVMMLPGEIGKIDIDSLIELDKRNIPCAIMTDGPILNPDILIYQAGEVMRFGGDYLSVLDMLTYNPAKIYGLDERIGSLATGKDADIVLYNGLPFIDPSAKVVTTIIDGEIVYRAE